MISILWCKTVICMSHRKKENVRFIITILLIKRCHNSKHFSELAPHYDGKTAGIDMVWRNYVTVTMCVSYRRTQSEWSRDVDVRYFTSMQWCLYDLVSAVCGPEAAAEHVEYNIILWQPPVTAFYCDLGIHVFWTSASWPFSSSTPQLTVHSVFVPISTDCALSMPAPLASRPFYDRFPGEPGSPFGIRGILFLQAGCRCCHRLLLRPRLLKLRSHRTKWTEPNCPLYLRWKDGPCIYCHFFH